MGQQISNIPSRIMSGSSSDADMSAEPICNILHLDVSLSGIHGPSYRVGDLARKMCHYATGREMILNPYVEITIGQTKVSTEPRKAADYGDATFDRTCLCLMLPICYINGGGTTEYKKLTVRVMNQRGPSLRGDPCIGSVDLNLNMSELMGKEHEVRLPIKRHGKEHGNIVLKYSVSADETSSKILQHPAHHSVIEVATALTQVLKGKNGLDILHRTLPKELVPPTVTLEPGIGAYDPLQAILVSLSNQVSMLVDDSDQEVLQRFARLSRSVQDFAAQYACDGANVKELVAIWIRKIFQACLSSKDEFSEADFKSFLPQLESLDEDRLQRFLEAGMKYPGINDLVPIDDGGNEICDWHIVAPAVPRRAILGQGSFGEVWRAKDRRTGRLYAVKNSRRARNKLEQRETSVTDHVLMRPHPCVVQIFGTHHLDSMQKSCLIMEFCAGGDLLAEITRWVEESEHEPAGFQPPRRAPFLLAQVILGLEHLHTKLVTLLRDLKPDNVVLTRCGHAKLADFGLSRIGAESTGAWTLQAAPPGTAHYVAPEVVLRKPYAFQADFYSLGVLTWNVLTGGLVDNPGIPPCVEPGYRGYEAFAENWRLINNCVQEPLRNNSRAMPCPHSKDFVLKLIKEHPKDRLDYTSLRQHAYTHQMNLPTSDAKTADVLSWLQQYEASLADHPYENDAENDQREAEDPGTELYTLDLPIIKEGSREIPTGSEPEKTPESSADREGSCADNATYT